MPDGKLEGMGGLFNINLWLTFLVSLAATLAFPGLFRLGKAWIRRIVAVRHYIYSDLAIHSIWIILMP